LIQSQGWDATTLIPGLFIGVGLHPEELSIGVRLHPEKLCSAVLSAQMFPRSLFPNLSVPSNLKFLPQKAAKGALFAAKTPLFGIKKGAKGPYFALFG
jgi:hypothetical protein